MKHPQLELWDTISEFMDEHSVSLDAGIIMILNVVEIAQQIREHEKGDRLEYSAEAQLEDIRRARH